MTLCKHCLKEFKVIPERRMYCGIRCKDAATRKIDKGTLAELALMGKSGKDMAEVFGVSKPRVSRALREYGLYERWLARRYA